jgi:DNA-binding SARP family transcriptional activator/predicted ATPase
MARLAIRVLGPFQVSLDGQLLDGFHSDKVRALLTYLCIEEKRPHRREKLAGLLWPDLPERSARTNLRHALANLRQVIRDQQATPAFLLVTRQTIQFDSNSDVWVDALAFTSALQGTEWTLGRLEQAVERYRGELLEGFSLPDSSVFEEWLLLQRERFQRLALDSLQRLTGGYMLQGEYERALGYAWRQVNLDPFREKAHRQLMRLLAYSDRASEALVQYETCRHFLIEELGTEPSAETIQLGEQIRDGTLPIPTATTVHLPAFLLDEERTEPERPLFVAREGELAQLDGFLDLALADQGRVAFVSGEAGSGKTALLQEFGRRAQGKHPDLLVAIGRGNAYTGSGDPYLPFRQVLRLLTGDVEALWSAGAVDREYALRLWDALPDAVQALVEVGPDLVNTLISGRSLLGRARAFALGFGGAYAPWLSQLEDLITRKAAAPAAPGPQQTDLFEQYSRVLQSLGREQALLLLLDDLQWADAGSISLLFHLSRQVASSRILIVGAYRPEEVALLRRDERHPLEPVIHELLREFGDVRVNMDQAGGREFLGALLDAEPNDLDSAFRQTLYRQTKGHPLFTIELLRGMEERGDLVRDASGQWVEGRALGWDALPARVEAVIAERIGRLDGPSQETLRIASVEGEEFTAEVVAQVLGDDELPLLRRLSSELDRQHHLLAAQSIRRLDPVQGGDKDGQRLSRYRFRHILFQKYLYGKLNKVEQAHLHERVGQALEALYADHPAEMAEITPRLARHFQVAGLPDRAVAYLHQAGERAVRLWANEEAVRHLAAGLALLETLPETSERIQQELAIQLALTAPLQATKGYAAPETGRAYARARELALREGAGKSPQLVQVLGLLGSYYSMRAESQTSLELYERALTIAEVLEDPLLVPITHLGLGFVLTNRGEFASALSHLEHVIGFYDPKQHRSLAFLVGQDIGASANAWAAWAQWFLGCPDRALKHSREALALAEASEHPFSICFAQFIAGAMFHLLRRQYGTAREHLRMVQSLAEEEGFPMFQAGSAILDGWLLADQGQLAAGIAEMHEGLLAWKGTGTESNVAYYLGLLAEACGRAGEVREGAQLVTQALDIVDRSGERFYEAELYRLRGQLLAQGGTANNDKVEACYQRAIEVARGQGSKWLELRAATSLSRLWQRWGKHKEARALQGGTLGWFAEGFDTPDLREARELLEQLELG